jgi:hypothetical protein
VTLCIITLPACVSDSEFADDMHSAVQPGMSLGAAIVAAGKVRSEPWPFIVYGKGCRASTFRVDHSARGYVLVTSRRSAPTPAVCVYSTQTEFLAGMAAATASVQDCDHLLFFARNHGFDVRIASDGTIAGVGVVEQHPNESFGLLEAPSNDEMQLTRPAQATEPRS